jgi:hypothetical protein
MSLISRTLLATLLVSTTALAGDIRTERVQFHKGANSATVHGTIKGRETVDYVLGARKGQSMNVSMATDNGANYFNIIAPGKADEAMFVGSTSSNQFEGTVPASGDYKVRVYLMRSAARRDEVAKYRLEMIID